MKNWYRNTTTGQKIFLYVLSVLLFVITGSMSGGFFFLGLIPLLLLIYLQLGNKKSAAGEAQQPPGK